MSVTIYSHLGELLHRKNMTVGDLRHQIIARFGLTVDPQALDRLVRTDQVRRPDLQLAGAAAAVLSVGLDDVFTVEAIPEDSAQDGELSAPGDSAAEDDILAPDQSTRLRWLYEHQHRRALTPDEWAEMGELVTIYARLLGERGVREIAARRRIPVAQVQAEVAADLEQAIARCRDLEATPGLHQEFIADAWRRQRARAIG